MNETKVIAIFDFDKTITAKHTFIRFLQYMYGKPYYIYSILLLLPSMVLYKMGVYNLMELREKAIKRYYKGIEEEKYLALCRKFVKGYINNWLLEEAIERIKWHKSQKHELVLLSNSPEEYLKIWASQFGFDYVMGSKFEFINGKGTGKLVGDHCFGKEKVTRLKKEIQDLDEYYIYGYGDSEGDEAFLKISDKSHYKHFNLKKIYNGQI